jgi:hypothetical protein
MFSCSFAHSTIAAAKQMMQEQTCMSSFVLLQMPVTETICIQKCDTPRFTFVVGTEMIDYTISNTRFKSMFLLMSVFQHHSLQQ